MLFTGESTGNIANEGDLPQDMVEAACLCWHPVGRDPMPKLVKIKDEKGIIREFPVAVKHTEKLHFSGISTFRFHCDIVINQILHSALILYIKDEDRWSIKFG